MASRRPHKKMKVVTTSPTPTALLTPTTLQSRDREGADLPLPIPPISLTADFIAPESVTFNGAGLPQPIPLTVTGPARHGPPNRSGLQ